MNYRRKLIQAVTFLGGLYYFLEFVLPAKLGPLEFGRYNDQIVDGFRIVGAMAIGLGLINIVALHGSQLIFKRRGWINSLALLCGLLLMIFIAGRDWLSTLRNSADAERFLVLKNFAEAIVTDALSGRKDVPEVSIRNKALLQGARDLLNEMEGGLSDGMPATYAFDSLGESRYVRLRGRLQEAIEDARLASSAVTLRANPSEQDLAGNRRLSAAFGALVERRREYLDLLYAYSPGSYSYRLLYDGLFVSLGSAMFALLGFYMASAAYRAFRLRSMESGLMLGAALLVMLGQIPFGLWIYEGFPEVRLWILEVPNAAAFRAIAIGAGVAGLIMAFRMWLSIESDSFMEKK